MAINSFLSFVGIRVEGVVPGLRLCVVEVAVSVYMGVSFKHDTGTAVQSIVTKLFLTKISRS